MGALASSSFIALGLLEVPEDRMVAGPHLDRLLLHGINLLRPEGSDPPYKFD
jgi:hypothetical protein